MNKSKYLIYTQKSNRFPNFSLFKVIENDGFNYTILGRGKSQSSKSISLYKINLKQFPADSWITLDSFVDNCTIIGKQFKRNKPIIKNSLSGGTYEDNCFTNKNDNLVIVAIYKNMWLYYDYNFKKLLFLDPEYIDVDLEFCENDDKNLWTKNEIASKLAYNIESKLEKTLYDDFEQ